MRHLTLLLFLIFAVPVMAQRPPSLPSGRVIDLSHPFDANTVYWPSNETPDPALILDFCGSGYGAASAVVAVRPRDRSVASVRRKYRLLAHRRTIHTRNRF